eukprot:10598907-Alexandrium_andersonii.AAC.1
MGKAGAECADANSQFKRRYDELVQLKARKGSTVNKRGPLQELVKQWKLASGLFKDNSELFKSGFLQRSSWQQLT